MAIATQTDENKERSKTSGRRRSLGNTDEITQPPLWCHPRENRQKRRRLRKVAAKMLPEFRRLSKCGRSIVNLAYGVDVRSRFIEVAPGQIENSDYYCGFRACGSVWTCPECSPKISEERRRELVTTNANWTRKDNSVALLTLTIRHHMGQPLKELLEKFGLALRLMKNRPSWKNWKKRVGLKHEVRADEIRYGENGWHPHMHVLLLVEGIRGVADMEVSKLREMWESACVKVGLDRPDEHGVDVRDGTYAARYMSKWGLEAEMTMGHAKRGKQGSLTPQDLIVAYEETRDERYMALFREFAVATKGRKRLLFSRGAREDVGLGLEKTDAEVAATDEPGVLKGHISSETMRLVLHAGLEEELLRVSETEGWPGVMKFLDELWRDRWENWELELEPG